MPDVKRTVKIVTDQEILPDKDSGMEGFPLRQWSMKVVMVHADSKAEVDADVFDKVTFNLHPSFGAKAKQTIRKPPFQIQEEGWGEFELDIVLSDSNGKEHHIMHDLNFGSAHYELKHVIVFKNPKPPLLAQLRASGAVPGDDSAANGIAKKGSTAPGVKKEKKTRPDKGVDMDKLADGLQRLGEDDLLQVVQMVHDNKSEESWTRNDVDQGEFHVDLYTLPESLIKMLWDFTNEKVKDAA